MSSLDDLQRNLAEVRILPREAPVSRGPSPNRGDSVSDVDAIGSDRESKREWQQKRGIDLAKQVRITKLSHMRYQHPDLDGITVFLRDFGAHIVKKTETERWFRGYGPDQYFYYARQGPKEFLGGAFEVESYADLEKLASIPGVTFLSNGIEDLRNAPGGGFFATIADPEGFPVNFIYGQAGIVENREIPAKLMINDETNKPRERKFQRFTPGPAEIYKLGHFGLNVQEFSSQLDWYTRHFNIIPSDILHVPDSDLISTYPNVSAKKEVAMFAHIDCGETLVDHHAFFLATAGPGIQSHVHHCSFEVHDFDTQALGHQWLTAKKYKSAWGLGRHILGSQIFDYWWDTTGNMVEHYADGDLVNIDTPLSHGLAGYEGLAVWGPEVPPAFLD